MGCDIHLYVEKRDALGQWQSADTWEPNPYYEEGDEYEPEFQIPYEKRFYTDRNYNLFAILANVRNGDNPKYGIVRGDRFNPIAAPRGLPADTSPEVKKDSIHWNYDGHNVSWFSLAELMEYDWTQIIKLRGWIDAWTYYTWGQWARDHGLSPSEFSGSVSGGMVKHLSLDEMEQELGKFKAQYEKDPDGFRKALQTSHLYACAEWEQTYYQVSTNFLSQVLPRLWKLADGNYENVRIVFWFDN